MATENPLLQMMAPKTAAESFKALRRLIDEEDSSFGFKISPMTRNASPKERVRHMEIETCGFRTGIAPEIVRGYSNRLHGTRWLAPGVDAWAGFTHVLSGFYRNNIEDAGQVRPIDVRQKALP